MTKSEFISLLNTPSKINEESVNSLKELKKSFPYCQISHILLAKSTHDNDSMHANEMLKKAAAYSTHRQILKKIIRSKASNVIADKVEKTEKVEIKKVEKANLSDKKAVSKKNEKSISNSSSNIIDELKKTLEKSKEVKSDLLKSGISIVTKSKSVKSNKKSISEVEIKFEDVKTEKKKVEEPIKPIFEENELSSVILGYHVFSSRLGNCYELESELTSEYPFPEIENNYIIDAPKVKPQSLIVDEFIEKSPKVKRLKKPISNEKLEDLAAKSSRKSKTMATETLGKLYASQGNKLKAIKIYKELILKNPEKRSYFAALIEKLEK